MYYDVLLFESLNTTMSLSLLPLSLKIRDKLHFNRQNVQSTTRDIRVIFDFRHGGANDYYSRILQQIFYHAEAEHVSFFSLEILCQKNSL